MRVTSSLSPDTHPGPSSLLPTQQPGGSVKPKADLVYLLLNPTVAPILLRTSPSLLMTGKGLHRNPTFFFSPGPSIPPLQTYRSLCYLRDNPSTSLPQGIYTCCSSSYLRDHVLNTCRSLNCRNAQKVGSEWPLEMSGRQPQCGQRARSDELCVCVGGGGGEGPKGLGWALKN